MLPSVLVSVSSSPSSSRDQAPPSSSGFVLSESSNGDTLVVSTPTSWLAELVDIRLSGPGKISWTFCTTDSTPQFTVLMQTLDGLVVTTSARILAVCLMQDVLTSLTRVFNSLADWRALVGDSATATNESLLLSLSCIALFKLTKPTKTKLSNKLCFMASSPALGQSVMAVGTPFGAFCPEVFYNCQSPGSVCKVLEGGLFITDASPPSGGEGSLIVSQRSSSQVTAVLGIIIAGLSCSNGLSSGLSLVCGAGSLWRALSDELGGHCPPILTHDKLGGHCPPILTHDELGGHCPPTLTHDELGGHCPPILTHDELGEHCPPILTPAPSGVGVSGVGGGCVVCVKSGDGRWGSGLVLTDTTVLSCHHVCNNNNGLTVCTPNGQCIPAEVVYSCPVPDCALLQLATPLATPHATPLTKALLSNTTSPQSKEIPCSLVGRSVTIIGYGCEDPYKVEQLSPLVTRGHMIKSVCRGGQEIMLLTTAVLLPGMSGGLVMDTLTNEPLGMAVSNTRECDNGVCHPRLNYCLPLSWVLPPVCEYLTTRDPTHLHCLAVQGRDSLNIWTLSSIHSKL